MSGNMLSKVTVGTRVLLGLIYFVFGLNGFLNFIPVPPMPENIVSFMTALMNTGYFMPVLKGTEVIGGAMLLTGIGAPLALVILAPITIQIFLFHAVMTPGIQNLVMPILMIILHAATASKYWHLYRGLFSRG